MSTIAGILSVPVIDKASKNSPHTIARGAESLAWDTTRSHRSGTMPDYRLPRLTKTRWSNGPVAGRKRDDFSENRHYRLMEVYQASSRVSAELRNMTFNY